MKKHDTRKTWWILMALLICLGLFMSSCSKKEENIPAEKVTTSNIVSETTAAISEEESDPATEEDDVILSVDAEVYFAHHGKIVNIIPVQESKEVHTEAESAVNIEGRGFSKDATVSYYSMEGTYSEAVGIDPGSAIRHPLYETYYTSASGEFWTIDEVNGKYFASPVMFNLNSETDTMVIVSETETIMSYDSRSNSFYETIPDLSVLLIKKVERVDAETLDKISVKELESL